MKWGRERLDLSNVTAIGIDEVMWRRGHEYLTLVYQIDAGCKRLLWIDQHRSEETIKGFFRWFTQDRALKLCYVCSDMWKPYLKIVAKMLRNRRELLLNWFQAKAAISSGVVEGLNNKVKVTTRKAYGYRSYKAIRLALYHNLGGLPEPELAHRFSG